MLTKLVSCPKGGCNLGGEKHTARALLQKEAGIHRGGNGGMTSLRNVCSFQ